MKKIVFKNMKEGDNFQQGNIVAGFRYYNEKIRGFYFIIRFNSFQKKEYVSASTFEPETSQCQKTWFFSIDKICDKWEYLTISFQKWWVGKNGMVVDMHWGKSLFSIFGAKKQKLSQ